MGTREVRLWHDQAIVKPGVGPDGVAETAGNVGWHQDYAHWQCASTDNFVTAWVALQDTDLTNGGMRTIVGSHRWGLAGDAYTFGEKDLSALEKRFRKEGRPWIDEPCVLKAGQASFHHALTFHGSGPNLTHQPRLCLIAHMMPEDCAVNADGRFHQNLDLLGPDKRTGDRFAGPCFPVLWKAS
jgi:ectoine hydroxylase-related dioxygenase (phytanoyl-CoA dioxygenase family)